MKRALSVLAVLALCAAFDSGAVEEEPQTVPISVFVTGKVTQAKKVVSISVTSARRQNGLGLSELNGTTLKVSGNKLRLLERFKDKDVEVRGTVKDNSEIDVSWVSEKKDWRAAPDGQNTPSGAVGAPLGARNAPGPGEQPGAGGNRPPLGALNASPGPGAQGAPIGPVGSGGGNRPRAAIPTNTHSQTIRRR